MCKIVNYLGINMKRVSIILSIIIIMFINTSCATLNKAHGELNYNNHISKGQELQDLKKALDEGAINQEEYDLMKQKIINDKYVKELIEKFDDENDEGQNRKASFNIEL